MLAMANSKERDRQDWIELLKEADPRFTLIGIQTPPKSELSMVEVMWEGPSAADAQLTNGVETHSS